MQAGWWWRVLAAAALSSMLGCTGAESSRPSAAAPTAERAPTSLPAPSTPAKALAPTCDPEASLPPAVDWIELAPGGKWVIERAGRDATRLWELAADGAHLRVVAPSRTVLQLVDDIVLFELKDHGVEIVDLAKGTIRFEPGAVGGGIAGGRIFVTHRDAILTLDRATLAETARSSASGLYGGLVHLHGEGILRIGQTSFHDVATGALLAHGMIAATSSDGGRLLVCDGPAEAATALVDLDVAARKVRGRLVGDRAARLCLRPTYVGDGDRWVASCTAEPDRSTYANVVDPTTGIEVRTPAPPWKLTPYLAATRRDGDPSRLCCIRSNGEHWVRACDWVVTRGKAVPSKDPRPPPPDNSRFGAEPGPMERTFGAVRAAVDYRRLPRELTGDAVDLRLVLYDTASGKPLKQQLVRTARFKPEESVAGGEIDQLGPSLFLVARMATGMPSYVVDLDAHGSRPLQGELSSVAAPFVVLDERWVIDARTMHAVDLKLDRRAVAAARHLPGRCED